MSDARREGESFSQSRTDCYAAFHRIPCFAQSTSILTGTLYCTLRIHVKLARTHLVSVHADCTHHAQRQQRQRQRSTAQRHVGLLRCSRWRLQLHEVHWLQWQQLAVAAARGGAGSVAACSGGSSAAVVVGSRLIPGRCPTHPPEQATKGSAAAQPVQRCRLACALLPQLIFGGRRRQHPNDGAWQSEMLGLTADVHERSIGCLPNAARALGEKRHLRYRSRKARRPHAAVCAAGPADFRSEGASGGADPDPHAQERRERD